MNNDICVLSCMCDGSINADDNNVDLKMSRRSIAAPSAGSQGSLQVKVLSSDRNQTDTILTFACYVIGVCWRIFVSVCVCVCCSVPYDGE